MDCPLLEIIMGHANEYLGAMVKNPVKESFYGKKKINILTLFFISRKSDVKTFFNLILNQCLKDTR